jgi:hypothetical protein
MNTNTTHDETKHESIENTGDGAVEELAVAPTMSKSVSEVFGTVSGNPYYALVSCNHANFHRTSFTL